MSRSVFALSENTSTRSDYQKVGLTCESGFQILPKLLELICEDQVGIVKTCAFVEDTKSYANTTVNHGEA